MNYLVIDLEMCNVPKWYRTKEYRYKHEIIQIGAVLLDSSYQQIATLSQYVHPEHGVIDNFIADLTGIRNENVKEAPLLKEALLHMLDWIGDREVKVFAWSESDRGQLLREITAKEIEDSRIEAFMASDVWVDYQAIFSERFKFGRCISLSEALSRADIDIKGRLHDGMDDAVNTARLIEKLEKNPEFKLVEYTVPGCDGPISSSLGDMLKGLNLQFA